MHRPYVMTLLVVLAGCAGPVATPDPMPSPSTRSDLWSHSGDATVAVPPGWGSLAVRVLPLPATGGEPSIGVLRDGTLFVAGALSGDPTQSTATLLRSRDHGATWQWVGDPAWDPKVNFDPWMWVDAKTDRVFSAPLYLGCTWLTWSDDKGATWTGNPIAGCPPTQHDHQKVTTGPPTAGVSTMGYPNVVYYAYNSLIVSAVVAPLPPETPRLGTIVSTSLDGGRTFSPGRIVHPNDPCHRGIIAPIGAAPDGTAYLPKPVCAGLHVLVSSDSGATWAVKGRLYEKGGLGSLAWMSYVDVDQDGTAYVVWTGADDLVYLSHTRDRGATWAPSQLVPPPNVGGTVFPVLRAGLGGRIVVAYLGTETLASNWTGSDPSFADADTVWHLYLTFVDEAATETPTFTTIRVTPEDDPVQRGCIWLSGGQSDCRNLLDFIGLTLDVEGRPYVVYTDGCRRCATADESRQSDLAMAYVEHGPSMGNSTLSPFAPA